MGHVSPVTCRMSYVTFYLSPLTSHRTPTLCGFSCYKSHRRLGNVAAGGLMDVD